EGAHALMVQVIHLADGAGLTPYQALDEWILTRRLYQADAHTRPTHTGCCECPHPKTVFKGRSIFGFDQRFPRLLASGSEEGDPEMALRGGLPQLRGAHANPAEHRDRALQQLNPGQHQATLKRSEDR